MATPFQQAVDAGIQIIPPEPKKPVIETVEQMSAQYGTSTPPSAGSKAPVSPELKDIVTPIISYWNNELDYLTVSGDGQLSQYVPSNTLELTPAKVQTLIDAAGRVVALQLAGGSNINIVRASKVANTLMGVLRDNQISTQDRIQRAAACMNDTLSAVSGRNPDLKFPGGV